jgi:hypothetical protein
VARRRKIVAMTTTYRPTGGGSMSHHVLTIRAATARDHDALTCLVPRGGARSLGGRALLAECDGTVVAAIGLSSGAVVADPMRPHAAAIHSLRYRRYRILRQGGDVAPVQALIRRLAPQVPVPAFAG